ncbi:MAG: hypothetical protein DDG60_09800 [Anaerolineae bacterium]|nr:MAG: hypothetical protein DDG60_09800 [Anaerolineae bacterium]
MPSIYLTPASISYLTQFILALAITLFLLNLGIDCATDPAKVGLALAEWDNHRTEILRVVVGSPAKTIANTIFRWLTPEQPALLAMDAPLGWPATLGQSLFHHQAGETIEINSDTLFRRETDRVVKRLVGRQPLDVGADRIARTAHAALKRIRQHLLLPHQRAAWLNIPARRILEEKARNLSVG